MAAWNIYFNRNGRKVKFFSYDSLLDLILVWSECEAKYVLLFLTKYVYVPHYHIILLFIRFTIIKLFTRDK